MLRFNELYITPDKKYLVIDVQVDDLNESEESSSNEYIDAIYVDTHDTFDELNTTDDSISIYGNHKPHAVTPIRGSSGTEDLEDEGSETTPSQNNSSSYLARLRRIFDLEQFGANDNTVFFVRAISATMDGEASSGICSMNASETIGVTYDKCAIYNEILKKLKKISGCEVQDDVIDIILRLDAFEMSLKTGKYSEAIELWKGFFENSKNSNFSVNCGCHG